MYQVVRMFRGKWTPVGEPASLKEAVATASELWNGGDQAVKVVNAATGGLLTEFHVRIKDLPPEAR